MRDLLTLQALAGNQAVEAWLGERVVAARTSDPPPADGGGGTQAPGLIVEDGVEPAANQQRKGEFTAAVRAAISGAVSEAVSGTPWTPPSDGEIDAQLAPYSGLDAAGLEQAVKRDAPGAAGAATAADLIPPVVARARAAAQAEISGAEAQVPDVATQVVQGAASILHDVVSILFKRRGGGRGLNPALEDVVRRLGPGQPLDGGVRASMEPTVGADLSGVRVHTDASAAGLSDELDARAFTVGGHVAFGHDEYRPGTPVGDALLAHELAHVGQQAGGPVAKGTTEEVEADADRAAAHAVGTLWGAADGAQQLLAGSGPVQARDRIGLRRCTKKPADPPTVLHNLPDDAAPLSAPGEQVDFSLWAQSGAPDAFETIYTTVGGNFDSPGGPTTRTLPAHAVLHQPFFVASGWNGTDPVTVDVKIRRKSDGAIFAAKHWQFGKKVFAPTSLSQFEHGPQPISQGGEVLFSYLLNPQPPADWKGTPGGPYYAHDTIRERFEGMTCNVTPAELKPGVAAANGGLATPEAIAAAFFPAGGYNASFTVGNKDIIEDRHSEGGFYAGAADLISKMSRPHEIEWDRIQVYEAQPGVVLGRYTIRLTMKGGGAMTIEKIER